MPRGDGPSLGLGHDSSLGSTPSLLIDWYSQVSLNTSGYQPSFFIMYCQWLVNGQPFNSTFMDLLEEKKIAITPVIECSKPAKKKRRGPIPGSIRGPYKGRESYTPYYLGANHINRRRRGYVRQHYRATFTKSRDTLITQRRVVRSDPQSKTSRQYELKQRILDITGSRLHKRNSSGFTGVSFKPNKQRWAFDVRVEFFGCRKNIGRYTDVHEAAAAYDLYVSQILRPLGALNQLNYENGRIAADYLCSKWDNFDDSWDFPTVANIAPAVKAKPIATTPIFAPINTPSLNSYSLTSFTVPEFDLDTFSSIV